MIANISHQYEIHTPPCFPCYSISVPRLLLQYIIARYA